MKIETEQPEKEFKPVTLKMTFENEYELKLFVQFIGAVSSRDVIGFANQADQDSYDKFEVINNFSVNDVSFLHPVYDLLTSHFDPY